MGAIRATAIVVLAGIAMAGAAVAGVEKALQEQPAPSPTAVPPPVPVVPDDPVVSDDPAVPEAPMAGAELVSRSQPPCVPAAKACVQLFSALAWVRETDGTIIGPTPVRVGQADSPTPVGSFPVKVKRLNHVSSLDGTPMPFAVFFADDVAFYQGDLTQPSAGSVRLPDGAAATFFEALAPGDLVQVVP